MARELCKNARILQHGLSRSHCGTKVLLSFFIYWISDRVKPLISGRTVPKQWMVNNNIIDCGPLILDRILVNFYIPKKKSANSTDKYPQNSEESTPKSQIILTTNQMSTNMCRYTFFYGLPSNSCTQTPSYCMNNRFYTQICRKNTLFLGILTLLCPTIFFENPKFQ